MDRTRQSSNFPFGRVGILLFLLFYLPSLARAERLPIKTYTTADGLPSDFITHIMEDSRGYLWFCTSEGLSRFDGYKFKNYGREQGLGGRVVGDLIEARNGVYWVATENGLCRFTAGPSAASGGAGSASAEFVNFYPGEDKYSRSVNCVLEDATGTIWCGTDAGLYRLDMSGMSVVFLHLDIIRRTPQNGAAVLRIIQDRSGSLWIVASSGLYRLGPGGAVEQYSKDEGIPEDLLQTVMQDHDGRIWVGSTVGLYLLVDDPKPHHSVVARTYGRKDGLGDGFAAALLQSADGEIWAATTLGLGVFKSRAGEEASGFRSYGRASGFSDIKLNAVCQDSDGNLWIGTASGGAMKVAADGLATYEEQDGVNGIGTAAIFEDRAGRLCVLNNNTEGLNNDSPGGPAYWLNVLTGPRDHPRFKPNRITLPPGIRQGSWGWDQITFQDSTGEWWMVTGQGLARYPKLDDAAQISHTTPKAIYTTKDGLPANDIFRLFEDSRHDIWIATLGNRQGFLARWERATQTFHRYSLADRIPELPPTAFVEDDGGNLWISFYDGTLARYHNGRFDVFPTIDGLVPGRIRGMYLDSRKWLWVATGQLGAVCIYDLASPQIAARRFSKTEGLSSEQATCITEDQWGMMYIGTGRGIDKLDPATGRIRHFTKADGLPGSFVNVALRDADGSLWFGTLQGLCRMVPSPERPSSSPPILITGLNISGVNYPLPELGAIARAVPELDADRNNIQIEFTGLSLAAADSLRYQYKLVGASDEWSGLLAARVVTYPNLPPGSYHFVVRAVSPSGAISGTPASVSFKILPPLSQRWWFRLLILVALLLPVIVIARFRHLRRRAMRDAELRERREREERLAELERVRTRIATDLHDDIGSSLSQIYLLSEVVRQRLGGAENGIGEPLSMISDASHEVVSSMSDIVWAINPKKDHLSDLVHRMRRFASDVFAAREIDFRFNSPDSEQDLRLGADIRREVFLIFKESVNNAVRHSGCKKAQIDFHTAEHSLELIVMDDGKGFDPCTSNEGHGLISMRERARSIGGELDLVSREGAGTTISFRLPLP